MKTISPQEAQALEDWEQEELQQRRTHRAISDTYSDKQPTKFRRKLPGKRKWKNKRDQYKQLTADMLVRKYNKKGEADRVLKKIYKRQSKLIMPEE